MISKAQIGRAGELLVQQKLLLRGFESSQMTTDSGIDLVAFSPKRKKVLTIQVKTNLKPKPAGGKGKPALNFWIGDDFTADAVALVDLSSDRIWLFKANEVKKLAQQHSSNRYQLYFYTDGAVSKKHVSAFHQFLFEQKLHKLL